MSNNQTPYIFSEAYNCGKIAKAMLKSFYKYHTDTIHVFGTYKDFKEIGNDFPNVEFIELSADNELKELYRHGHRGTAHIFAKAITEHSHSDYIIHIDSDVIFREEALSLLTDKISEGYDLVGPRRCYKNNANGRKDLDNIPDVTQTCFFAFNKTKINTHNLSELRDMCLGIYTPLNIPILDFFDPVEFEILQNGGKIFFLDPDQVGGLSEAGSTENIFGELNKDGDFGTKIIHFAGIGSGMKCYVQGRESANSNYANWAIKRYALYCWLVLGEKLENFNYDEDSTKRYDLMKEYFVESYESSYSVERERESKPYSINRATLILVSGSDCEVSLKTLKHSCLQIDFGSIKLLTTQDLPKDDTVEIIKINSFDYVGYQKFMIYELYKYVDTEFALIIQNDGYVVNPQVWTDAFLEYDYIGALWPQHPHIFNDINGACIRVGNGGFSLRSKKLMELPTKLNIPWEPNRSGGYNEDVWICCKNRHIFEQNDCKFAPAEVAKYFSTEQIVDKASFGFHGKGHEFDILKNTQ